MPDPTDLVVLPEIADALAAGRPVVALESTIISHGLPRPDNFRIAQEIEQAVRDAGAVPATVAMVEGRASDRPGRTTPCTPSPIGTTSSRSARATWPSWPPEAGTAPRRSPPPRHLAARAGIAVFATGGLGGVHRGREHDVRRVGRPDGARPGRHDRRLRRA